MSFEPAYHFTPPKNWMNDPNGMVYYKGEFHLFYQHYPYGLNWGTMHWGHAVSKNLISWKHLPVALFPDKHGTIFSGSAIVDMANTSGFASGDEKVLVAIFTYFKWGLQRQGIAYSTDCGRTWTPYKSNPVIKNPFCVHFRDPKVFWHKESAAWVMVLTAGNCIRFYTSSDLKNWKYVSSFGKKDGSHGSVWECPDLFPLAVDGNNQNIKWVLLVSVKQKAPNGASGTQYFIGSFDGTRFINDNSPGTILWLDYGKDNYAGVTWSDVPENDGRRLFIAWMSNWQYAAKTPADRFRGEMTLPRELTLSKKSGRVMLVQKIVHEIDLYLETPFYEEENISIKRSPYVVPKTFNSGAFVITVRVKNSAARFDIVCSNDRDENVRITCDMIHKIYSIDRTCSSSSVFSTHFFGVHTAPFLGEEFGTIEFELYFDRTSVECIACGGLLSITELVFPAEPFLRVELSAPDNVVLVEKIKIRGVHHESVAAR